MGARLLAPDEGALFAMRGDTGQNCTMWRGGRLEVVDTEEVVKSAKRKVRQKRAEMAQKGGAAHGPQPAEPWGRDRGDWTGAGRRVFGRADKTQRGEAHTRQAKMKPPRSNPNGRDF